MQKGQKEPVKVNNKNSKVTVKSVDSSLPVAKEVDLSNKPPSSSGVAKSLSPKKDPSSSTLQKHNHHDDIETKIKTRKRILDTLEQQTSFCTEETLAQLSSRDAIIEEQNKELVALRSKLKHDKKKEQKSKTSPEIQKITELESEKSAIETKYLIIVDKYRNEISKLEQEKLNFEVLQETLNEEIEVMRTKLKGKDNEIAAIITDVQKLSEIIQQFKGINNELNIKIEKQNEEYAEMNTKFYEGEVKVSSLAETEVILQDYMNSYQRAEARGNKLFEELRSTQIAFEDFQAFCKFAEEKLSEVVKEVGSESEAGKVVLMVRSELGKKAKVEVGEKKEKKNKENLRKMQEELDKAKLRISQLELQGKPLIDQVDGLKALIESMKKEHSSSLENLNKTIKTLQDLSETQKSELLTLRQECSKKDQKISSLSSKLSSYDQKLQTFPEKLKKFKEKLEQSEKESSDFRQKISLLKSQMQEKKTQMEALEKQNTKYILNIQALHEEFWKKDTILIKMKKTLNQLQKSSVQAKSPISKTHEGNDRLLKELQEKDQKIELLKEMVKSSHLKKESRKLSPDTSHLDIHHQDKTSKMTHDLVNSLAAKTINKFFTLCSFHKKSSQDSPPDLQRLLKKLRQDLKSYSNFSVKDLQSSVSQLQYHYFDNKSHVSLEELLEGIKKVVNQ